MADKADKNADLTLGVPKHIVARRDGTFVDPAVQHSRHKPDVHAVKKTIGRKHRPKDHPVPEFKTCPQCGGPVSYPINIVACDDATFCGWYQTPSKARKAADNVARGLPADAGATIHDAMRSSMSRRRLRLKQRSIDEAKAKAKGQTKEQGKNDAGI